MFWIVLHYVYNIIPKAEKSHFSSYPFPFILVHLIDFSHCVQNESEMTMTPEACLNQHYHCSPYSSKALPSFGSDGCKVRRLDLSTSPVLKLWHVCILCANRNEWILEARALSIQNPPTTTASSCLGDWGSGDGCLNLR